MCKLDGTSSPLRHLLIVKSSYRRQASNIRPKQRPWFLFAHKLHLRMNYLVFNERTQAHGSEEGASWEQVLESRLENNLFNGYHWR